LHKLVATATHPPLFPALLWVFDLLGLHSIDAQRLALAGVTCSSVLVMGLLGRKVAGPIVGIIAAVIAALNPLWLGLVGSLMSESIYLIIIALMLLLALRCLDRPTIGRFAILGVVIALAALTRSEAIDFVVFLGLPLLIFASVPWKRRSLFGLAFLAGLILLLGPWLIRNEVQVGGAVLSDEQGGTLAGSYCNDTFSPGNLQYGGFSGDCAVGLAAFLIADGRPPDAKTGWTEITLDRSLTKIAETYARHHLGQLPGVVVAREARTWELGNHSMQLQLAFAEGRNRTFEQLSWILYWILVPFVLVGAVVLARTSWRGLTIVAVPIVVVAFNVAIIYGSTRFRVAAEPSLTVLAAVGIAAVAKRLRLVIIARQTSPHTSTHISTDHEQDIVGNRSANALFSGPQLSPDFP
jgi:4-amino-4-deoxy-L-arabinose transferase-like glycosyltransferase